jgi:GH24 family phage-related lysozyme (muramidase)
MKFNFQRPDGSSVRVEAPSRDAALKYWKAQAKPPAPVKPVNASVAPDDRGTIPLTNPAADPNVPVANATGGPDERVPAVAPSTANASLSAPTKAEVDAGKNMTGDGLIDASVKAAMNAPGQVLTGIMGLDRSSRDTFTAALDQMAANADELAANPGTQQVFENMARELPSAATGGNPKAFAATMWQRFQDPAQRQDVIKELGMANAKANAGTQLKIAQIQKDQQPINVQPGSLEYYVSNIIGSTAQMAPGLVASVVTKSPLPAMAIIAAQQGGDAYTKASNAGLKPEEAKKYAALYAMAETIPEALPLHMILKEGGKALPRMLKGALGEGVTEMLTEGIEALVDKGYISPDMTWGEVWPRIRDAGIIGAGAGAGMGALAAGTESAVNTAGAASGEVISKLQAGLDKVVRQSAMAADMAKMLAGKSLEERIKIYADAKRQQMETPEAKEPTAAEKGGFDPATVIKGFEGFSTTPYWDVNANRAGFGSDTITEADGTVRKVQPGDKVTREDAERDLARRLDTEFIPSIMKEVGVQAWGALDARTQAALASVTYNYGNLPNKVAAAVRTGDTAAIADAVEALGTDNNGVNANRRAEEAAIIRGEEYTPREPVEVKRPKLSTDPATYKGKRTAAVMIGDEVFTGERHAVAVQKAIEQFGAESAQIKTFEADPEAAIGQLAGKAGETLAGAPYPAGFEVTGMSADGGAEITSVIAKAAKAAPTAQEPPPVAQKPPVEAITPAGKRVSLQPEIVDIGSLSKATGAMQPRDRSRAASDAQIEDIAINLDPARLTDFSTTDRGAPIIGPDSVVESGNGRIAAIRRAAEAYPEKYAAYRKALEAQGYDLTGIQTPVLVGRRTTAMDQAEREAFAKDSNTSAVAQLSATEQATADAKLVDRNVVDAIEPGTRMGPKFVTAFLDKLPQAERSRLADKAGHLNSDGVRRINNALLAAAYGDPQTTARAAEDVDDSAKSITGALTDVAPEWIAMRQSIKDTDADPAYDMTDSLMGAINMLARAREKAAQQGRPVKALINEAVSQIDMLSGDVDPIVVEFIKAFYSESFGRAKSRDDIATFLRAIASEVQAAIQPSMFGDNPNPEEVIGGARKKSEREADTTGDIFAAPGVRSGAAKNGQVAQKPGVQKTGTRDTQQTPLARKLDGTKAVDAAGNPVLVYHGTARRFGAFDISRAGKASGDTSSKAIFWVDSMDVAKGYRGRDLLKRGEIKEAYLVLKNPRVVDFSNRSDVFDTQLTKGILVDSALADGHDGVIFQNIIDNKDTRDGTRSTVYAVFDPAQVVDAAKVRAEAVSEPLASAAQSKAKATTGRKYPLAPHGEWFGNRQYKEQGAKLEYMTPDEFLAAARPLAIDESSRENIDELKAHIRSGKTLDPLALLPNGKEDGRHRAYAAKELGITSVPVLNFRTEPKTRDDLDSATHDLKFNPGAGYQPMLQAAAMPARQTSVQVSTGTMAIPDKVTIRDEPRKKLLDLIGERLYQGKVKGKTRLGFYRRNNSEVRIKHFDDIEVMAHEAAHFLDFHHEFKSKFTAMRQRFAAELNPLSYTQEPGLINLEGFAEYVRLWATQYATAKRVAPNFTAAFEAELKKARLWRKMTAFQQSAHRWYYQGDLARFRGKSGESQNVVDQFKAFMRSRFAARFLQGIYDPEYGALVMERETTGGLASAERSPYKLRRMTRAAESMTEAAVLDGALVLKPDGSYTTTGPSLMQIFWPAVKKGWAHFDKLMEYFKARRAQELMGQGRENLFTKDEIKAGLEYGNQFPEFEKIFDQWLGFNDKMLDFYVDMNRITPETAAAIRKNNTAYVPFFRVINRIDPAFNKMGKGGRVDTRLVGGERNTNEILANILDGLHANIQSALYSRANSALFKLLSQTQDGSEFAARIPADSKKLKVAQDQQVKHIADALVQLGFEVVMPSGMVRGTNTTGAAPIDMSDIEDVIAQFPELADFWQHNQEPSTIETMVEPVIIDGKQEYFEVNSPLLAELLTVPRGAPALVRALGAPKRFVTKAITSTIQFMAPNITRDTTGAAASSQSGFTPYVESLRGLKSYLANDPRFKEFRVNGGLFSGRVTSLQEENLNRSMLNFPSRNGWDTVGKALAGYGRVSAAFEQGTRIGEFARATEGGANPLEAAYRGRMISGDFAQKGRNELWGWLLETIPFANAGLRGTETLLTNMFAVDGKARFNAKSAGKLARMTVTRFGIAMVASTMILWALNNDDERYKALTVDEKTRFWHVWLPSGEHIQIPKPYGVGFIFADLPEIAMDFAKARLEGAAHHDAEGKRAIKDAMDQLAFSVMQHFWFMDNPAIIAPTIEAMQNRKFTGAPIVPANLSDLRGDDLQYQRTDRTPEVYRRFSETLAKAGINISPLIAEHYMKGFTGYLEAYMVDATESLFWDTAKWGERPFARGVLDYFTHQFNGSEAPFRTKWTEGYYDLAERAASKAQAYSTLFKEAPRDIRSLTEFTEKDVNLALRSINKITTKINTTLAKTAGQLISVKYDPKLTREQKEKQINDYYLARNAELRTAYEQMDSLVTQLEEGKKAKP